MESLYEIENRKQVIFDLYDQKLGELNIDFEYLNIETSYGHTNILVTGRPSNPPLIIIHRSNGCAPIALETTRSR